VREGISGHGVVAVPATLSDENISSSQSVSSSEVEEISTCIGANSLALGSKRSTPPLALLLT